MIDQITLRCAQSADETFLRMLYVDTHPEFAALPPAVAEGLCDLQLRAQRGSYSARFPTATDRLIERGGTPVGRCWTYRSDTELRLLDLAILSSHQRQGIGRTTLQSLASEAAASGVALHLSVWQDNIPARRLYEQFGFVVQEQLNGYLGMVRT